MCLHAQSLSGVQLFVTPGIVAHQAPLSMGFCGQKNFAGRFLCKIQSGWPFPPVGDLPDSGTELASPLSSAWPGRFFTAEPPGKPQYVTNCLRSLTNFCTLNQYKNWKKQITRVFSCVITLEF